MSDLRARLLDLKAQNAQLAREAQEKAKEAEQWDNEFKFTKEHFDAFKERGLAALRETELNRYKDKEREQKQQNKRLEQLPRDTRQATGPNAAHSHAPAKISSKSAAPSVRTSSSKYTDRSSSAVRARPATAAMSVSLEARPSTTKEQIAGAGSPTSASSSAAVEAIDADPSRQEEERKREAVAWEIEEQGCLNVWVRWTGGVMGSIGGTQRGRCWIDLLSVTWRTGRKIHVAQREKRQWSDEKRVHKWPPAPCRFFPLGDTAGGRLQTAFEYASCCTKRRSHTNSGAGLPDWLMREAQRPM